jgi:hypothetical protein
MNFNITKPIDIPQPRQIRKKNNIKKNSPSSSYSSSLSLSNTDIKKIILRGAPFVNINTMKKLINICIPKISLEEAEDIVKKANENDSSEIITCGINEASLYCSRLIENGLIIDME